MHHGFRNLERAINLLNQKDRSDFYEYVKNRDFFNPNIMFIAKPQILNKWFDNLFPWLEECEKIFGFENLKVMTLQDYMSILQKDICLSGLKKYTKYLEFPDSTIDWERWPSGLGARLESVYSNPIVGSNPTLSAKKNIKLNLLD